MSVKLTEISVAYLEVDTTSESELTQFLSNTNLVGELVTGNEIVRGFIFPEGSSRSGAGRQFLTKNSYLVRIMNTVHKVGDAEALKARYGIIA